MKELAIISTVVALSAPATAEEGMLCPDPVVTLDTGQSACVSFIYLGDSREFTVFLRPNTIPRAVALANVHLKGSQHCRSEYGLRADPSYTASRGSWATPGTWQFTGSCK